jgi:hypothetical protein
VLVFGLTAEGVLQLNDYYVENYSFELPGDGKIKGWDMEDGAYYTNDAGDNLGPAEVPG